MSDEITQRLFKEIQETTNCALCLDTLVKPRILPCHHTYCEECLEQHINAAKRGTHFPCPNCRHDIFVSRKGVKGFPAAFRDNTLVDILDKYKSPDDIEYNSQIKARKGERDVRRWLDDFNSASDDGQTDVCEDHGEPVKYFCIPCNKVICLQMCMDDHLNDRKVPLSDEVPKHKKTLMEFLEQMKTKEQTYQDVLDDIGEKIMDAQNLELDKLQEVDTSADNLIEIVKEYARDAKEQITSAAREAVNNLKEAKTNVNPDKARVSGCVDQMTNYLEHGSGCTLIQTSQRGKDMFKEIVQELQPQCNVQAFSIKLTCPKDPQLPKRLVAVIGDVPEEELQAQVGQASPLNSMPSHDENVTKPSMRGLTRSLTLAQPDKKIETFTAAKVSEFSIPFAPEGVCCSPDDEIIVCQHNGKNVHMYNKDGEFTMALNTPEGTRTWDVACDEWCIYVTDTRTKAVLEFQRNGEFCRSIQVGFKGHAAGLCKFNDILYVTSRDDDNVYQVNLAFDPPEVGVFVTRRPGVNLWYPSFVSANEERVAVSCTTSNHALVFNVDGQLLFQCGGEDRLLGGPDRLNSPKGIQLDTENRLLIVENWGNQVCLVSADGDLMGYIKIKDHDLKNPSSVTVGSDGLVHIACGQPKVIVTYELEYTVVQE